MEKEQSNNISSYDENWESGLAEMCIALSRADDSSLIKDFLSSLLTPTELQDVSNRWRLVKEVKNGTTQREISRKFGISLCKITRGSRELKKPHSAFKSMMELL